MLELALNCTVRIKEKFFRKRPGVAYSVGRGITLIIHDRSTRKG